VQKPSTQASLSATDSPASLRSEASAPAREAAVVTAQHRDAWLAKTGPAALDVPRFWFEEWDEDRVQGGKGRYNDKWLPHGPLGAAGSAEVAC
jgi:hypothetical protein